MRVILHLDLDCFYAQVEQIRLGLLDPVTPLVVQQWNSLIAVNYPARSFGITRHMNINEARQKCPHLVSIHTGAYVLPDKIFFTEKDERNIDEVIKLKTSGPNEVPPHPNNHKVSLDLYRQASKGIFKFLRGKFGNSVEKASVDEAFIDVTNGVKERMESEFPDCGEWKDNIVPKDVELDWNSLGSSPIHKEQIEKMSLEDVYIWIGALIAKETREELFEILGYTCSIGIAPNKTLAKLATSVNKPNGQTFILPRIIGDWMKTIPFEKIRFLGGKLGQRILNNNSTDNEESDDDNGDGRRGELVNNKNADCIYAGDLWDLSLEELMNKIGGDVETAKWVYNIIRGVDESVVKPRALIKSFLSAKNFCPPISMSMNNKEFLLDRWVLVLCRELVHRLEEEAVDTRRWPRTLTVSYRRVGMLNTRSKAVEFPFPPQNTLNVYRIAEFIVKTIKKELISVLFPLGFLGISVGRFGEEGNGDFKNMILLDQFIEKNQSVLDDNSRDSLLFPFTKNEKSGKERNRKRQKTADNPKPKSIVDFFTKQKNTNIKNEEEKIDPERKTGSGSKDPYPKITCEKCKDKKTNIKDTLEHSDYHYAMKLAGLE